MQTIMQLHRIESKEFIDMAMTLFNEDCLKVIPELSDESLDIVITSPPYNVDLGNNKYNKNGYDLYRDNMDHSEYIEWLCEVFRNIFPKLKTGGRVCLVVGDGKNGSVPTTSDIIQFMSKTLSYIPMTHIIWNKKQTSARTAWGSWMSPSSPSFPTPFEHILVFAKGSCKLQYKGESDITREEFIKYSLALWEFPCERDQKKIGHPAMFPKELVYRLLKMFTYKKAVVYDPFMGAGTTGVVCQELERDFIGSEISEDYCRIADRRIFHE